MAKAYRWKARYIQQVMKATNEQMLQFEREVMQLIEAKMQNTAEMMEENKVQSMLFNIKRRDQKTVRKIQEDYWTTEKKYMMRRVNKLNERELNLINEQIDKEFSCKELLSVLGLNKDFDNEYK